MSRRLKQVAVVFVVVFAAAQLIRPERANPTTDSNRTIQAHAGTASRLAAVLDRACGDCHSNKTVWPCSWSALTTTSPMTTAFMTVLFRVYGAYNVAFGLLAIAVATTAFRHGDGWAWWALLVGNTIAFGAAMTYDWTVSAIGPFELSEYVGLAAVYGALAVTAPFLAARRPAR